MDRVNYRFSLNISAVHLFPFLNDIQRHSGCKTMVKVAWASLGTINSMCIPFSGNMKHS